MRLWCPELTALDCSYCSSLTDIGMASLVAGCPRLDTLSLSVCSRLTSPGLRCLQRLARLRILDLSYTDLQVHSSDLSVSPKAEIYNVLKATIIFNSHSTFTFF